MCLQEVIKEQSTFLCPVSMRLGMLIAKVVCIVMSFGTGVPLLCIMLIQKPDAALLKLDSLFVQIGIKMLG